ncbi:unnamed protein product [Sphagnum balticum]
MREDLRKTAGPLILLQTDELYRGNYPSGEELGFAEVSSNPQGDPADRGRAEKFASSQSQFESILEARLEKTRKLLHETEEEEEEVQDSWDSDGDLTEEPLE